MKTVAELAEKFGIETPSMITSGVLENENFILKDYTSLPPFRQNRYEVKNKKTGETRYFAHDTENSLNYPGYLNIDRNPIAEILEYVQLPKIEEHTTKLPKKYLFGNIPFVPKKNENEY